MSESNVKPMPRPEQQLLLPLVVTIAGRIERNPERLDNGNYLTKVRTPSPDGFSAGSAFIVTSKRKLGVKDEEIKEQFQLNGWVTERNYTDKKTGELRVFQEAKYNLIHVE